MKILLDTGVWWRWVTRGPLRPSLRDFLAGAGLVFHLCPISLFEITYKVSRGRLTEPKDVDWPALSVRGFISAPVTMEAARLAGEWPWEHGDPADRLLAAVAATQGLTLVHTDGRLEKLRGFPQRYFRAVTAG